MPAYRQVPLEQLFIDPNYQRNFDERHAGKIEADFDEALLGVLEVSDRGADGCAVFDGQHRFRVLEGMARDKAPCLVHTGLTPGQEADLFRRLQDGRKQLQPLDRFKARLFADPPDPVARGIDATARELGFKIGPAASSGELAAIVVAERVYRRGNLHATLSIIGRLWRRDKRALDGSMIDGLSRFMLLYSREFDEDYAVGKWEEVSPVALIRKADSFLQTAHSAKAYGVLQALREAYQNKNHRLPSVERAMAERRQMEREGQRRYRRVPVSEVRDAGMELKVFTYDTMASHLRISKGAAHDHINELTKMDVFRRLKVGANTDLSGTALDGLKSGQWYYEHVPIHLRKRPGDNPRSRPRHDSPRSGGNSKGTEAVAYTGKPIKRTGNLRPKQKAQAERGKRVVQQKKRR